MLRAVGVALARVDLKFFDHRVAKRPLGQHSLDSNFKGTAWKLFLHLSERRFRDASGITGVAKVFFVFGLIACHTDLVGIDHHNEVTCVYVGRELCLVFTAQVVGQRRGKPA